MSAHIAVPSQCKLNACSPPSLACTHLLGHKPHESATQNAGPPLGVWAGRHGSSRDSVRLAVRVTQGSSNCP